MINMYKLKNLKRGDKIQINDEEYEAVSYPSGKVFSEEENKKIRPLFEERSINLIKTLTEKPKNLKELRDRLSGEKYQIEYDQKGKVKFFKIMFGRLPILKNSKFVGRKEIKIKNAQ